MALDSSNVIISNSSFRTLSSEAGAVFASNTSHVALANSAISDSRAAGGGAGIVAAGSSTVLATNTTIIGSSARAGAGALVQGSAKVTYVC
jgi:hypothetical protein